MIVDIGSDCRITDKTSRDRDEFLFEVEENPSPFKVITGNSMNVQNRRCNWSKDKVEEGVYYDFNLDMVPMDYTIRKDHELALIIYGIDAQQTQRPMERTEINLIRDSIKVQCHICS